MKSAFRILGTDPRVLKIVREPLPDEALEGAVSLPERIRREIEGMREINHPCIVKIIAGPDIREIESRSHVWYIEPLFDGGTLADRLIGPLPQSECLDLLCYLAKAAEELAVHGVVHRDIKPSNIVFDESDRPVLLDLGIAYFKDLTPLTNYWDHSPMTPAYAAPEQFDIRMNTMIDFRTDLFLIGIVVFEALTGLHPFSPSDPDGYFERLRHGHIDRDALDSVGVSTRLSHLLERLLAPSISRRFRLFSHLYEAIEECR